MQLEEERTRLRSQLEEFRQETDAQLRNHEETISLLVSEKTSLTSQLNRLAEVETSMSQWSGSIDKTDLYSGVRNAESSLEQEKAKNVDLESQREKLYNHVSLITSQFDSLQRKEKEMDERLREQVYTMLCIHFRISYRH